MTTEVVLPLATYPNGTTPTDTVDVPDSATVVRIATLRCTAIQSDIWPDTETFGLFASEIDTGTGFDALQNGAVEGWGGIAKNKFGVDIPEMWCSCALPSGTGRRMRGSLTVTDGPLRTQGYFEFLD